ncbi:hypothetical protein I2I11_21120 [Pontibacter sp. 172403-2]|uniref:hypothetical protein n=1 Tax=Pontibacter rufus TaxID=2791028 RepID=UPI0018AFC591|nr:hypothetical protein [Pontibacter sp. 172403-2]MBF9255814.1 hypothetical protein [Pontibacter sp. 172403-2]
MPNTTHRIKTAYNMRFAKMAGDVVLGNFLHLTKVCAGRQSCAFYPPSSQSAKRWAKLIMIKLKFSIALLFAVSVVSGCTEPKTELQEIQEKLVGTWELDSILTVRHGLWKRGTSVTLTFVNDENFTYEWWQTDVGGKYNGKYFISSNPNRGLTTVTLIPDTVNLRNGTFRRPYINFDIMKLQKNRLVTLDQSEFIERQNQPSLLFTEKKIYKKSLAQPNL